MTAPCPWPVDPLCSEWDAYSQDVKDAATNYATLVLWAATGRRFGLCPQTVRPCGTNTDAALWGYVASGEGTWVPYIDYRGTWRNGSCVGGGCAPRSEVWLPGPIDSIVEVIQNGVVVNPSAYVVDDRRWLVRVDGGAWPSSVDLSTDAGRFEVTYVRGTEVPKALREAAGVLACEFAKARAGKDCRLPGRMTALTRGGVSMSMVDTESLVSRNFTGIPEVDQVIFAYNPYRLFSRPKVMTPDVTPPRMRR